MYYKQRRYDIVSVRGSEVVEVGVCAGDRDPVFNLSGAYQHHVLMQQLCILPAKLLAQSMIYLTLAAIIASEAQKSHASHLPISGRWESKPKGDLL